MLNFWHIDCWLTVIRMESFGSPEISVATIVAPVVQHMNRFRIQISAIYRNECICHVNGMMHAPIL